MQEHFINLKNNFNKNTLCESQKKFTIWFINNLKTKENYYISETIYRIIKYFTNILFSLEANISFDINIPLSNGSNMLLCGSNGSGKTTLISLSYNIIKEINNCISIYIKLKDINLNSFNLKEEISNKIEKYDANIYKKILDIIL